jgi:cytochrome P450
MIVSTILLLITFVILLLLVYVKYTTDVALNRIIDVRTGKPIPMIGFFHWIGQVAKREWVISVAEIDVQNARRYGSVYSIYEARPTVKFSNPKTVKTILKQIDEFPKALFPGAVKKIPHFTKIYGDHAIINVNNPKWHEHRSILNKAFTSNSGFIESMRQTCEAYVSHWIKLNQVPICTEVQKLTLDILATCIFGIEFNSLQGKLAEPIHAYNFSTEHLFSVMRILLPWYNNLPLAINKELSKQVDIFDKYCWKIIDEAQKKAEEQKIKGDVNNDKPSLVDLMNQYGMDNESLRDNVSLFFLAGHETTSSALGWEVGLLASKPEVQNKARKEVLEKIPDNWNADDLKNLEYLDAFIRETLRMYPPAPHINSRTVEKDTIIEDIFIPSGTIIDIDMIGMSNNPEIWGDPDQFRPERFFPQNLTSEQRNSWIPFTGGPRVCIGKEFSLLEQKIFLVTLLKQTKELKLAPHSQLTHKLGTFFNSPDTKKLIISVSSRSERERVDKSEKIISFVE